MAIPYFNIMQYQLFGLDNIPAGEAECITKNRPFHVFVVSQHSYAS